MANTGFRGSVTTSGTSEAIRLDKALFRNHPEFRQKAKVMASVIGRGQILISLLEDAQADQPEDDPVLEAFLSFLERDLTAHPRTITKLSRKELSRARSLTKGVAVADDEALPDNVTF